MYWEFDLNWGYYSRLLGRPSKHLKTAFVRAEEQGRGWEGVLLSGLRGRVRLETELARPHLLSHSVAESLDVDWQICLVVPSRFSNPPKFDLGRRQWNFFRTSIAQHPKLGQIVSAAHPQYPILEHHEIRPSRIVDEINLSGLDRIAKSNLSPFLRPTRTSANMATELTVQSERAFQKQPHVSLVTKSKTKRPGKGGVSDPLRSFRC